MKNNKCTCGKSCSCRNCICGPEAAFLDVLANEGRLYLLRMLERKAQSVTSLVNATKMEQTLVSHNLKRLESAGFVSSKRSGKQKIYEINEAIVPFLTLVRNHAKKGETARSCCCS